MNTADGSSRLVLLLFQYHRLFKLANGCFFSDRPQNNHIDVSSNAESGVFFGVIVGPNRDVRYEVKMPESEVSKSS